EDRNVRAQREEGSADRLSVVRQKRDDRALLGLRDEILERVGHHHPRRREFLVDILDVLQGCRELAGLLIAEVRLLCERFQNDGVDLERKRRSEVAWRVWQPD